MFSATMRLDDSVVGKARREEFVESILEVSVLTNNHTVRNIQCISPFGFTVSSFRALHPFVLLFLECREFLRTHLDPCVCVCVFCSSTHSFVCNK